MKPTWQTKDGGIKLYRGDCRDVLPLAEPVATVVTDPPYDLTANKRGGSGAASVNLNSPAGRARITAGFMGQSWDGTGVAFEAATWAKVLESLLPGGMLLAFGGTRTYHRMTCAIEDAGFEIRDCLAWLYGSGFPKSLDISKALDKAAGADREVAGTRDSRSTFDGHKRQSAALNTKWREAEGRGDVRDFALKEVTVPATDVAKLWDGWGTALKPAFEPITLAMKPLEGTYAVNAQRHGVAGLNIHGARIPLDGEKTPSGSGDRRNGTVYAQDEWTKTQMANGGNTTPAAGRWPANVILDDEAGAVLDAQAGPLESGKPAGIKTGNNNNIFGQYAGGIPVTGFGDAGGASRFFYCPKADEADRRGSKHPTVKPVDLIKYLCKLTQMPTGGTVLDCFMGSGTTLEACYELHRPFVGIEREAAYFDDCVSRAKEVIAKYGLFQSA